VRSHSPFPPSPGLTPPVDHPVAIQEPTVVKTKGDVDALELLKATGDEHVRHWAAHRESMERGREVPGAPGKGTGGELWFMTGPNIPYEWIIKPKSLESPLLVPPSPGQPLAAWTSACRTPQIGAQFENRTQPTEASCGISCDGTDPRGLAIQRAVHSRNSIRMRARTCLSRFDLAPASLL
jgi:hypothetical protein